MTKVFAFDTELLATIPLYQKDRAPRAIDWLEVNGFKIPLFGSALLIEYLAYKDLAEQQLDNVLFLNGLAEIVIRARVDRSWSAIENAADIFLADNRKIWEAWLKELAGDTSAKKEEPNPIGTAYFGDSPDLSQAIADSTVSGLLGTQLG